MPACAMAAATTAPAETLNAWPLTLTVTVADEEAEAEAEEEAEEELGDGLLIIQSPG